MIGVAHHSEQLIEAVAAQAASQNACPSLCAFTRNGFPSSPVGHISVTHMHQDDRIFQRTPCTAYRLNRSRRVTARVHPGVAIHRLPPAVERRPALALRVAHRQYGVASGTVYPLPDAWRSKHRPEDPRGLGEMSARELEAR
jgi:hypothetical protein